MTLPFGAKEISVPGPSSWPAQTMWQLPDGTIIVPVAPSSPASNPRFFVGTLTTTGELFLVPAERREEWNIFDKEAEETCEVRPMPEWAKPMQGQLEHLEFEMPKKIFS